MNFARWNVNGTVLVIDDEPEYLEMVNAMLSDCLKVLVSCSWEEGLRIARDETPDAILLDVRIPNADGVDICGRIRSDDLTKHIPILMLTGACDHQDRVRAFSAGADDYIFKPFTEEELRARVISKIRRMQELRGGTRQTSVCGNLKINFETNEVRIAQNRVHLTPTEFQILKLFLENRGRIISRREILEKAWSGCVITERTVDSHIASLRRKLVDFDHVIATKHGVGFLLKSGSPKAPGLAEGALSASLCEAPVG